ncbi:MAG: hypothetical protein Q7R33_03370 [Nitrosarchaeum sp.]|nr:hypothetical protein [Nitrosarchaeum sp.]
MTFYCGSASNIDEILPLFDAVFLLEVSSETTRQRLISRTENDFGRTLEVRDWIMSWKEWWENDMKEKGAIVIDAHKSLDEVAGEILDRANRIS